MKSKNKIVKRRDFLEWMAIAGVGGISGLHLNLPERGEGSTEKLHAIQQQGRSAHKTEKLGFHVFSKHLQFLDYEAMADVAAEIGFDGVDLTVRPGGHVLPENVEEALPKAVAAIRNQGLEAKMMTTALTDAADKTNQKVLRTASEQGIGFYRTGWLWYQDELSIEENFAQFNQILGALGKLNQELNIVGDYQNHAGFSGHPLGGPIWDLAVVLAEMENPFMGCQYDIRHATVEGGTSWPLGLKRIQPQVHSLVVKDFKWEKVGDEWKIINTPVGEGMVDFRRFFSLVKEYEISAPISVHFEYEMPEHQKELSKEQIKQKTIQVMQKDLNKLKGYMKEAGLEG